MRYVTAAVAVAAVLAMTGMMIGAASAANVKGQFADNSTSLCNYTNSPGDATAVNSQSQTVAATFSFDGAGGLAVEFVTNSSNVPSGTRSTSAGSCTGTYLVGADNAVTTDVACDSTVVDGAGAGNSTHVPSITSRFIKVGDELFRMPAGPPAEETIVTSLLGGGTATQYRKCSRVGALRKGVR